MNYNKFLLIVVLLSFLALNACSSTKEKTFGERLTGQGAELEEIGEKWSDGEKLIVNGTELIEEGEEDIDDGESLISKGESKIKKGESLIKKGNRMKAEAEEAHRLRVRHNNLD